jgi:outer membrane murein-binding lipoprotein Lpp
MKNFKHMIWFAGIVAGVVVWGYASFATKEYVDEKEKTASAQLTAIKSTLDGIDKDVREIRSVILKEQR